ncbi:MAG: NmrA family NAD(P)-binding protein [Bacteroidetes bacterium]|nr:NmrA family NAD(P)-binding protein [Bacteroidota bacterium]
MKVLVIGGTGMVGSHVVQELRARDVDVYVLTRSMEKAEQLPTGVKGVVGDLLKPDTVRSVFGGVDGVFLLNAVSTTEAHEGLMAVNGARMADVDRIVYLSVHDVDHAPHLPHFGAKLPVEMAIQESGIDYTILRPNNFFQNDLWSKEALLQYGVYPQPIGTVGLSRVDVRDIAEAAALALTTDGHAGATYNLVGPEVLTGPDSAARWSDALGKPITYGGDDLDAWEQQALQFLPPFMVFDFRLMYAFFQERGLKATDDDVARLTDLLGRPPRRFEDFARETAQQWQG